MLNSFRDLGKRRGCFGTLFFWFTHCVLFKNRRESQSDHFVFSAICRNFFEAAEASVAKSCRNSQSDHFIISATVPLFDLQEPGLYPTIRGLGILRSGVTEKGCKGGTQETCRANHLQINIEARLKGAEPRKKKHNYSLVFSNALIFGTIQP